MANELEEKVWKAEVWSADDPTRAREGIATADAEHNDVLFAGNNVLHNSVGVRAILFGGRHFGEHVHERPVQHLRGTAGLFSVTVLKIMNYKVESADEYLRKHRIMELFEDLSTKAAFMQPENLEEFLAEDLKVKQKQG